MTTMALLRRLAGISGVAVAPPPPAAPRPAANVSRLGDTIDLRQNPVAKLLALFLGLIVVAMTAGLWFGMFTKTETARGIVSTAGGFARLDAPKAGVIASIYVKQGDYVQPGTPIFLLSTREETAGGETANASELRTLEQSRATYRREIEKADAFLTAAREQKNSLEQNRAALLEALDNQQRSIAAALDQARATTNRVRELVRQGYTTREVLEAHERTGFEYDRQLTEVNLKRVEYVRQDAEKLRDILTLIADKETLKANDETQIDAIDARIARIRIESRFEVQAQSAGRVLAIAGQVGDSVAAGQLVAAVGDDTAEPIVILDTPARATGLIKVGQSVVLKYDAFPFKTFGIQHGVVTSISNAAIRAPGNQGDSGLDPRPIERQSLYRIEVKPQSAWVQAYGERQPLRIGSTLSADIVVEKRRLIDWVLDPIRAMEGRT